MTLKSSLNSKLSELIMPSKDPFIDCSILVRLMKHENKTKIAKQNLITFSYGCSGFKWFKTGWRKTILSMIFYSLFASLMPLNVTLHFFPSFETLMAVASVKEKKKCKLYSE